MSRHDSIARVISQTKKRKNMAIQTPNTSVKNTEMYWPKSYIKFTSNLKELWSQSSSDHRTLHLREDSCEAWDRTCAVLGKKWCLGNSWEIHVAEDDFKILTNAMHQKLQRYKDTLGMKTSSSAQYWLHFAALSKRLSTCKHKVLSEGHWGQGCRTQKVVEYWSVSLPPIMGNRWKSVMKKIIDICLLSYFSKGCNMLWVDMSEQMETQSHAGSARSGQSGSETINWTSGLFLAQPEPQCFCWLLFIRHYWVFTWKFSCSCASKGT